MQAAVFHRFPQLLKVLFTVLSPLPVLAAQATELPRVTQELAAPVQPASAQTDNTAKTHPLLPAGQTQSRQPVTGPSGQNAQDSADAAVTDTSALTFTVLADSALGTGVFTRLAGEAERLAPATVTVVFKGLPVDAKGNFRRDEGERRLAPLLTGKVPTLSVVIDPVRWDNLRARAGTAVSAPSVLIGTPAGDVLCTGTAGLLRALHEARTSVKVPAWQSALTDGLKALPFDAGAEGLLP